MESITLREMQALQTRILQTIDAICTEHGLHYYLIGGTLLGAIRHSGFIPWDDDVDIALPREHFDTFEAICRARLPEPYQWVDYKDHWEMPGNLAKIIDRRTVLVQEAREDHQVDLGVYVDVFPLDGVPKSRIARSLQFTWIKCIRTLMAVFFLDNRKSRSLHKRSLIALIQTLMPDSAIKWLHVALEKAIRRYHYDSSSETCNFLGGSGKKEYFPKSWLGLDTRKCFEGMPLSIPREYHAYLTQKYGDYLRLPPEERRRTHHRYTLHRVS